MKKEYLTQMLLMPAFQMADYLTIAVGVKMSGIAAAALEKNPVSKLIIEHLGLPDATITTVLMVLGLVAFFEYDKRKGNVSEKTMTNAYRAANFVHAYICLNNLAGITQGRF